MLWGMVSVGVKRWEVLEQKAWLKLLDWMRSIIQGVRTKRTKDRTWVLPAFQGAEMDVSTKETYK